MNLSKRPAKIGGSINSRSEKHGEEDVPAMDIPIDSLMLTKAELNELMRDRTYWDRIFNERKDGLAEPANRNLKPFCLTDKYEHCSARISVGIDVRMFAFNDCDISKIKLTPVVGGLTELSLTVQVLIDVRNTALFEFMAKDCDIEISLEKLEKDKALKKVDANQPELALDVRNGNGKGDEHPDPRG